MSAYLYIINNISPDKPFDLTIEPFTDIQLLNKIAFDNGRSYSISLYACEQKCIPELQSALNKADFDYILSEHFLTLPKLIVFDMDSTLIPIEVIDELARLAGQEKAVSLITESAMNGDMDFNESLTKRVKLLDKLSESAIETLTEQLKFNYGVEEFCHYMLSKGTTLAIASGGFTPFANELKKRVPFEYITANQLEIQEQKLTGRVIGPIINAQEKAKALESWANKLGLEENETMAIGDGANDLLMLAQASLGLAYHAKDIVNESTNAVLKYGKMDSLIDLFDFVDQIQVSK